MAPPQEPAAPAKALSWSRVVGLCAAAGCLHTAAKVFLAWRKTQRMRKRMEDIPLARYEDPGNFLGSFKGLIKNRRRMHEWIDEISHGLPVCKLLGLPFEPAHHLLIVRDPACIKHFLKDSFDLYTTAPPEMNPFFYFFKFWIGDGIVTLPSGVGAPDLGQAWHRQRKLAASIFSRANFQTKFQETFVELGHRLCQLLTEAAQSGGRVDLQRLFFGYTMDGAMAILCGEASDTMRGQGLRTSTFDEAHWNMVEYVRPSLAKLKLMEYLPFPFGGVAGLAWLLHGAASPACRRFLAARRKMIAEADQIVARCRADPNLGQRRDLLALFVQSEEKQQFSTKYLRDMIMIFIMAARDTTASLLSWSFYVLATHPEVQAKLAAEVDEKLPGLAEPSLRGISASTMPYLNGVVYEVLRLYPPVPSDQKVCMQDDVLPDGTRVAKGTALIFHPWAMGRDDERYPDALAVKPERWIPFKAPAPHEFPQFQAGPRTCLGQDMAIFEAKVCLAMLLQRFSFTMPPGEADKIHYSVGITMSICNSKQQDSHNLWIEPHLRAQPGAQAA